ncbi:hypothetical protein PSDVSF_03600 [Pseudodesulfovibrio sediminis]|uniref:Transposase zinc-ribbon domain-containing protein n=1 Tax=Pseudodesulfovibrio sediminis TaxID=2810563 RepID=A0ABM7P2V7_9BACT|nr:transposase [Pseudodesulfovibrio sediminis]BCS87118.1 hypothetical protein PSDVSF_03600 [Pseudodesulfovibrio sediminis]
MQQNDFAGLIQIFERLDTEGQRNFFNYIRRMLGDLLPISDHLKYIRDTRFADGFSCPHCGGEKVKHNGTYSGRQRYLCHSCKKTFNDWTGTPMAGTHYTDRWMEYIQLMLEGKTLKQCAKTLEISIPTAFYWRP